MNNTGIMILAAGNSSRLGKPKQLLLHRGKTLLQHTIEEAVAAGLNPVVLVLGANAKAIASSISGQPVMIVENPDWTNGMASSMQAGISTLMANDPEIESFIIAVCDQPFLTAAIFRQLITEASQSGKGLVACAYGEAIGTPALFHRRHFPSLLQLKGDEGAKKIIRENGDDLGLVPFPEGKTDIDTMEDYWALINS